MARQPDTASTKKPLTRWEKIKAGVKGFVKTVIHYVPRGLLIAPAMLAGSWMLGNIAPGLDVFHAHSLQTATDVAGHIGKMMVLGGLISGGVGAWQSVKAETAKRDAEMLPQGKELHRCHTQEREITHGGAFEEICTPSSLPSLVKQTGRPQGYGILE